MAIFRLSPKVNCISAHLRSLVEKTPDVRVIPGSGISDEEVIALKEILLEEDSCLVQGHKHGLFEAGRKSMILEQGSEAHNRIWRVLESDDTDLELGQCVAELISGAGLNGAELSTELDLTIVLMPELVFD